MFDHDQMERTEDRYERRADARAETEACIARGEILEADSPERVRMRLARKGVPPEMAEVAMRREEAGERPRAVTAPMPPGPALNALERIIGASDLIRAGFLADGARVARSVCRIEIREASGLVAGYGTGVMISARLLLTNNHVLDTVEAAAASVAEFGYEADEDGEMLPSARFDLDPETLFVTDPMLDYTVVGVAHDAGTDRDLTEFGWVPLIPQQGKVIKGEFVNIVQHPNGEPKQVALRENQVVDLLDDFLHYKTDTAPGSSGSPVFNDEWEMVALHHSGVPARDSRGTILAIGGGPWSPEMGEHRVRWVANEGARVSRIVAHLQAQPLGTARQRLVDAALAGPPAPTRQTFWGQPPGSASAGSEVIPGADGAVSWTIPLQVTIQVGSPVATGTSAVPADGGGLAAALADLQLGRTRLYYDEATDTGDRERYYAELPKRLSRANRFRRLSALLSATHRVQPRYEPRRHLYPWVDLQPNGMLRSIYTGEEYDPKDLIREDFRIEREREAWLRERIGAEVTLDTPGAREALDLLEARLPYNCEHVVPQSWFGKREPMRGDLHHLFACEGRCNSFRNNTPYFEFPEFEEAVRRGCGMTEGNRFEPSHGKGAAARATLYFLLRYPGEIDAGAQEYDADRLELLLAWHVAEPPDAYERHRNAAIFAACGNRNPLIDHPEWAAKIDFTLGLAPPA